MNFRSAQCLLFVPDDPKLFEGKAAPAGNYAPGEWSVFHSGGREPWMGETTPKPHADVRERSQGVLGLGIRAIK